MSFIESYAFLDGSPWVKKEDENACQKEWDYMPPPFLDSFVVDGVYWFDPKTGAIMYGLRENYPTKCVQLMIMFLLRFSDEDYWSRMTEREINYVIRDVEKLFREHYPTNKWLLDVAVDSHKNRTSALSEESAKNVETLLASLKEIASE